VEQNKVKRVAKRVVEIQPAGNKEIGVNMIYDFIRSSLIGYNNGTKKIKRIAQQTVEI